jgi:release factor glutamine methyltransferase
VIVPPGAEALYRDCHRQVEAGVRALPDKPEETVEATVAALWHAAALRPLSAEAALAQELPPLPAGGAERLAELLGRRLSGTPLAHLTGRSRFMGLEMLAGPGALIPRRETELVGAAALERLRAICEERGAALVVDVCTGSGNLALALAHHEPRARVHGADLSPEAVELARRNAETLGLAGRVEFRTGDLLAPFDASFDGRVDLLTCNPPYISSAKVEAMPAEISGHEPRLAFDGGPLGIRVLDRLVREAPRLLRPGGWLAFEVGLGQGRGLRRRLEQRGTYAGLAEACDPAGEVRALLARYEP